MGLYRGIGSIIDRHTLASVILAVASTWICGELELFAEFPLTMVGTAVIFPIVKTCSAAD